MLLLADGFWELVGGKVLGEESVHIVFDVKCGMWWW